MAKEWTPTASRRAAYIAATVIGAAILVPVLPSIASSLSSDQPREAVGAPMFQSTVVSLQVVPRGMALAAGQLAQPRPGQSVFITCPGGQVISGGYELPEGATKAMLTSAPSLDSMQWRFRYAGDLPLGTRFFAICAKQ